jgi:hypothetical protein
LGAFEGGFLAGLYVSPDDVLAGHLEMAQVAYVVGLGGVACEFGIVGLAPFRDLAVEGLFQAILQGTLVIGPVSGGVGFVAVPEGGQVRREIVAEIGIDVLDYSGCAGLGASLAAFG